MLGRGLPPTLLKAWAPGWCSEGRNQVLVNPNIWSCSFHEVPQAPSSHLYQYLEPKK